MTAFQVRTDIHYISPSLSNLVPSFAARTSAKLSDLFRHMNQTLTTDSFVSLFGK